MSGLYIPPHLRNRDRNRVDRQQGGNGGRWGNRTQAASRFSRGRKAQTRGAPSAAKRYASVVTTETKRDDEDRDLEELLGGLSLDAPAPSDALFRREIKEMPFTIFIPVIDLGYFSWKPDEHAPYQSLRDVKSRGEVTRNIYMDVKPPRLVDLSTLARRLPMSFLSLHPHGKDNRFPHGQFDAACLHVASRKVDLDTIDFAFGGGSTLEMLANRDAEDPFMATVVPHTANVILVSKRLEYTQNLAEFGFQFERLVTGGEFADRPEPESIEHLHIMRVGHHNVFFRAETDALGFDGEPVEVKASNPYYWGTKVMFQMIASGSATLCHGEKGCGNLYGASTMPLSQVAKKAAYDGADLRQLERNILQAMSELQMEMIKYQKGDIVKISFVGGHLKTAPISTRSSALLPPNDVVRALFV